MFGGVPRVGVGILRFNQSGCHNSKLIKLIGVAADEICSALLPVECLGWEDQLEGLWNEDCIEDRTFALSLT